MQAEASTGAAGAGAATPRIWALLSDKRGDNAQVETVVEALGLPVERKTVLMLPPWELGKPKVRPTLDHIDLARSDRLEAPWPELILTIGRRPSSAALWVRQQSGGRSRIVLFGKPSGRIDEFELIIYSAEIQMPPLDNVMPIGLPLMRVDRARVDVEAESWRQRLADLPRPLVGFLIGGPTGPYRMDESVVDRFVELADDVARRQGGTPYLTTSRRTPGPVVDALREKLPTQARLFTWGSEAADNPYQALLGLADGLIVTADSISMMVEVARLERPLAILPLPSGPLGALDLTRRRLAGALFQPRGGEPATGLRRLVGLAVNRTGLLTHTRDFGAFHDYLVTNGMAVWAGEPFRAPSGRAADDRARVVHRIREIALQD